MLTALLVLGAGALLVLDNGVARTEPRRIPDWEAIRRQQALWRELVHPDSHPRPAGRLSARQQPIGGQPCPEHR